MYDHVLQVGEVTAYLHSLLGSDDLLSDLWVRGEVSNLSRSTAGHVYFTLKDDNGQLRCVLFRGRGAGGSAGLDHGSSVLVHGRVDLYEAQGNVQLYADFIQAEGVGSLHQQFEELKARLADEGLFDEERKQPLPPFPRRLGVVTSPSAAAFQDVLRVLSARFPAIDVVLSPSLVQGENAPPQIAAALSRLDRSEDIDVILLVRGGGSLEELWAFNTEEVAQAIAACHTPIVSGVGHETDFTIADLVADLRMPTPSAAAAAVVPDWRECASAVGAIHAELRERAIDAVSSARHDVAHARRTLTLLSPRSAIRRGRQYVDDMLSTMHRGVVQALVLQRARLAANMAQLTVLSPQATLDRGYAIVTNAWGEVIGDATRVTPGELLHVRVRQGEFDAFASE